ncbi:hypothetical protein [Polyangium aurulentum]|uniref:hypothetical protein n=1 Tax=Polyangium aurulentum TaxID=2567896 RepID=UPI0010ADFACD|nr:hypothetical protein [Polyangium aurulentum]UQA60209.1 hypothetical protein E8A73_006935 [Polyangium aurulentum]
MPNSPFETDDAESAFKHFSPLVDTIPEADLDAYNADADIVRVNARRGTDAIRPHLGQIEKALPLVPLHELLEIPSLALALGFAAARVFTPASPQQIKARQASLRPARELTLRQLEILAELSLVPADRVRHIRANRGSIDEADDAVAIVAFYGEHKQALAGKHPFDDAYLQKLADDGNWLVAQLTPVNAKPAKSGKSPDALVRDRLWTELNRRYDELYKAGVVIWGRRKVDEHVPSLFARQVAQPSTPEQPSVA